MVSAPVPVLSDESSGSLNSPRNSEQAGGELEHSVRETPAGNTFLTPVLKSPHCNVRRVSSKQSLVCKASPSWNWSGGEGLHRGSIGDAAFKVTSPTGSFIIRAADGSVTPLHGSASVLTHALHIQRCPVLFLSSRSCPVSPPKRSAIPLIRDGAVINS